MLEDHKDLEAVRLNLSCESNAFQVEGEGEFTGAWNGLNLSCESNAFQEIRRVL